MPDDPSDQQWRSRAAALARDWAAALRQAVPIRELWQRDMLFDDDGFWMRAVGGPGRPEAGDRGPEMEDGRAGDDESWENASPVKPAAQSGKGKSSAKPAPATSLADWLEDRRRRARSLQNFVAGKLQWMAYEPALAVAVNEEFGDFNQYKWRIMQALWGDAARGKDKDLAVNFEPTGAMARRLYRFLNQEKSRKDKSVFGEHVHAQLYGLAGAYRGLHGGYFTCAAPEPRPASDKRGAGNYRENWEERLELAEFKGDSEAVWACELALKGRPKQFTDFFIVPLYGLRKADGHLESLVRLVNRHGSVSEVVALGGEWKSTPTRFRDWFGKIIHGTWGAPHTAGQNELDALMGDLAHEFSAAAEVRQLTEWGWHAPTKAWFAEDLAILPGGREVRADADGIFWFDRQAFRVVKRPDGHFADAEGNRFKQPPPRWQPGVEVEEKELKRLFIGLSDAFYKTVGGDESALVLGLVFAYAAAPEIFAEFKAFPGLFLHGEKEQGKSWIARLCMRVFGFDLEKGVVLQGSTAVGTNEVLMQVSNLPVWLDEFSLNVIQQVQDKLKNAYDRSSSTKHGDDRPINTAPLVVGEHTVRDAATKSRYGHVLVAKSRRRGTDVEQQATFQWMRDEMPRFFLLGRHALRRRDALVPAVLSRIRDFMGDAQARATVPDDRARLVHAVAYGGYEGFAAVLGLRVPSVKEFLIGYARTAAAHQASQVNLNVFWDHLVTCYHRGVFGDSVTDLRRYFYVERVARTHAPGAPNQTPWISYRLFVLVSEVLAEMKEELNRQHEAMPLSRSDLLEQMKSKPYFLDGKFNRRFREAGSAKCWGIEVDEFGPHQNVEPLGYVPHSDAEVAESRLRDVGDGEIGQCPHCDSLAALGQICCDAQRAEPRRVVAVAREHWRDPRKGPLIKLCERLAEAGKREE